MSTMVQGKCFFFFSGGKTNIKSERKKTTQKQSITLILYVLYIESGENTVSSTVIYLEIRRQIG